MSPDYEMGASTNNEWDPEDDIIATLLAEGLRPKAVAEYCGVSTKTIYRRLQNPNFAKDVSDRKKERLNLASVRLSRSSPKALDVLLEAMDHEDVKVRMTAAKTWLQLSDQYHRRLLFEADIEERIAELERQPDTDNTDDTDPPKIGLDVNPDHKNQSDAVDEFEPESDSTDDKLTEGYSDEEVWESDRSDEVYNDEPPGDEDRDDDPDDDGGPTT